MPDPKETQNLKEYLERNDTLQPLIMLKFFADNLEIPITRKKIFKELHENGFSGQSKHNLNILIYVMKKFLKKKGFADRYSIETIKNYGYILIDNQITEEERKANFQKMSLEQQVGIISQKCSFGHVAIIAFKILYIKRAILPRDLILKLINLEGYEPMEADYVSLHQIVISINEKLSEHYPLLKLTQGRSWTSEIKLINASEENLEP